MTIELNCLQRRFANHTVLDEVSLSIAPGEFLALLGPSGSGKTTLLRILAGLDQPDHGSFTQHGRSLLNSSPRERKVGLVFQHYALFQHLSVTENIAFGLRVKQRRERPSRAEIMRRVEQLLSRVHLDGMGSRYPAQLSGGQRQRVALARALAVEPELLLLDEPFGALDAQVRQSLRRWLRNLHDELRLTTVFVTHDQEEALELADRVALMNRGRIEQIGTPEQIYLQPATPFACEFIGKNNPLPLQRRRGSLLAGNLSLGDDPWRGADESGHAIAYVRPEHLQIAMTSGGRGWTARLRHIYLTGSTAHLELAVESLDRVLEAELRGEELSRHGLEDGMTLLVRPRQLTLFPLHPATDEPDIGQRQILYPHYE